MMFSLRFVFFSQPRGPVDRPNGSTSTPASLSGPLDAEQSPKAKRSSEWRKRSP